MFVLVPEPVWKMSMGKCSSSLPSINSSAACSMQPRLLGVELAEFQVGAGGGGLTRPERAQERAAEAVAADREIQHGALRGRAVERVGGHGHLAHAVFFDAGRRGVVIGGDGGH